MTITAAIGVSLDSDRSVGVVCTLVRRKGKDEYVTTVLKGSEADSLSLELTGMIQALEASTKEPCVIYTSAREIMQEPSPDCTEQQKSLWDRLQKASNDPNRAGHCTVRVHFVRQPDTKAVTRMARKRAHDYVQEELEKNPEPGVQEQTKREEAPVRKPENLILKVKEPEPPKVESLSKEAGRIPIMENMFTGSVSDQLQAETTANSAKKSKQEKDPGDGEVRQLSIHQDQIPVLTRALELYARLGMGQMADLGELIREGHIPVGKSVRKNQLKTKAWAFDEKMAEAEKLIGLDNRAGINVFDETVTEHAKVSWDMYKSLTDDNAESMEFAGKIAFRMKVESN